MVHYERMSTFSRSVRLSFFFAFLFLGLIPKVYGEDTRTQPIDVFILIDRSAAMTDAIADAREWICSNVVDGMLIPGDRVDLWTFSDNFQRIYSREIVTPDFRETLKKTIRGVTGDGKTPKLGSALASFLADANARPDRNAIAYVLVAGSMVGPASKGPGDEKTEELLRFSRVEAHPGWKAVVVGIGLEEQVRRLTKEYLRQTVAP